MKKIILFLTGAIILTGCSHGTTTSEIEKLHERNKNECQKLIRPAYFYGKVVKFTTYSRVAKNVFLVISDSKDLFDISVTDECDYFSIDPKKQELRIRVSHLDKDAYPYYLKEGDFIEKKSDDLTATVYSGIDKSKKQSFRLFEN